MRHNGTDQPVQLEIRTQGLGGDEKMCVTPGVCSCGDIKDGVSLRIWPLRGSWVISFADLERVYRKAKELRDSQLQEAG